MMCENWRLRGKIDYEINAIYDEISWIFYSHMILSDDDLAEVDLLYHKLTMLRGQKILRDRKVYEV